jgi:DNA-binding XRE family transcriptional regulator
MADDILETSTEGMEPRVGRFKKPLPDWESQRKQYGRVSTQAGPGSKLSPSLAEEGNLMMELGFSIWLVRQSRKMTQAQLATRMQTTRTQVSELECGQVPKIATLFRVARALRVTPACLILIAENRRREFLRPPSVNR